MFECFAAIISEFDDKLFVNLMIFLDEKLCYKFVYQFDDMVWWETLL